MVLKESAPRTWMSVFVIFVVFSTTGYGQKPVITRDTTSVLSLDTILIKPLLNDYDPGGTALKLDYVSGSIHGKTKKVNDSTVRYSSYLYTGMDSMEYRIRNQGGFQSDPGWIVIDVKPNMVLPVAMNDSASGLACEKLYINVLKNDYDPLLEPVQIDTTRTLYSPDALELEYINDSVIMFHSLPTFSGKTSFTYRIRKIDHTGYYSALATVWVTVTPNPLVPVAYPDSIIYKSFTRDTIDALSNDYCPPGYACEIKVVDDASITSDQKIEFEDSWFNRDFVDRFIRYQIRRTDDTNYYSDWAKIKISYRMDSSCFLARPDSFTIEPYLPVTVNLLKNDYNPHPGDSIHIYQAAGSSNFINIEKLDSTVSFTVNIYTGGQDTLTYIIRKKGQLLPMSFANIYVNINNRSFDFLDINNVKARINAFGNHFFPFKSGEHGFFAPKNSQKGTLFAGCLWIGGRDINDSLHFAGEKFRQGPTNQSVGKFMDFWAGPVTDSTEYSQAHDHLWHRVWKINRSDVEYHKFHFRDNGYTPIEPISSWPANGNTSIGQASDLAPYIDQNKDGHYNPMDGDYPKIFGDQSVFFIYNDGRDFHSESQGTKLKVEIHGWAYAFDYPSDTALNHTFFMHYDIYNRSIQTYYNTWLGCFTDFDIGWAGDDYVGCDVERNMFFGYNGKDEDGTGQTWAYGIDPPAQSITIMAGPRMDSDGIDNPRFDQNGHQLCDPSVNGMNFGDSITDNERFGMTRFTFFNNTGGGFPSYMLDPFYSNQFYDIMQGIWHDGSRIFYGGLGHLSSGGYGPDCNFMFPGESDTLNWGTDCTSPNGPKDWTEKAVMNNPGDRRGVASMGPFTFKPGDKQELDLCYTFARDLNPGGGPASVDLLRKHTDKVVNAFKNNTLPNGEPFFGIKDNNRGSTVKIFVYPNPASNQITVELHDLPKTVATIEISDLTGQVVLRKNKPENLALVTLNTSNLDNGLYFLIVKGKDFMTSAKIIIRK